MTHSYLYIEAITMNTNVVGTLQSIAVASLREAKGNEVAPRLEKMKKADAIVAAAAALDGTHWLSSLLR